MYVTSCTFILDIDYTDMMYLHCMSTTIDIYSNADEVFRVGAHCFDPRRPEITHPMLASPFGILSCAQVSSSLSPPNLVNSRPGRSVPF